MSTPRLKDHYEKVVKPALIKEFGYTNEHAIPRLDKVVLNMGVGEAATDSRRIEAAVNDLTLISGQKPVVTKARRSIAQYKLRAGMKIGCKVTIRRDRMYEMIDRLVTIAMPRIRDFRGLSAKSFDGRGNYAFGITEQIIFPEIDYDKIDRMRGMDIVICTTAKTDQEAKALLKGFKFPIKDQG